MELSNFKYVKELNEKEGKDYYDPLIYAEVDVTTGFWFFKKTERRLIYTEKCYWRFVDTDQFTPDGQAEYLAMLEKGKSK